MKTFLSEPNVHGIIFEPLRDPAIFVQAQVVPGAVQWPNGADLAPDAMNDPRGHSCLLLGLGDGDRPVHVVCSPKDDYLAIITAYLPDPAQWSEDFRRRR